MMNLKCHICEQGCILSESNTGLCGMYRLETGLETGAEKQGPENEVHHRKDAQIVEQYPDRYLVACPISIETMPMLHYYPGGKFLQISTTGCNLNCPGCISSVIVREMQPDSPVFKRLTPEQIVEKAIEENCIGIAFLMNDPLASLPTFLSVAKLARSKDLLVGCSSNTYFSHESLEALVPYLNFINIGMKGFSDGAYHQCGASKGIAPVLRNIHTLFVSGVHIEISCILTQGSKDELLELAMYLRDISPVIPLQVMRFIPFEHADISMEPSVLEAEAFCQELRGVLKYVYLFNTPGTTLLNTVCPKCESPIIQRDFYGPMGAKSYRPEALSAGKCCPQCSFDLNMAGTTSAHDFQEGDFEGGYPFTRALEIVEAMLIAMGVREKQKMTIAWESLLEEGGLGKLHHSIQKPGSYIDLIRHFGNVVGASDKAAQLAGYMEDKLALIKSGVSKITTAPKVYYAMAKPLFYINSGRLENQLAETAGGISVNRELPPGGRPGRNLAKETLISLNPDVMFISAFISNTVADFYQECLDLGIRVSAVENRQIFTHPSPGWDFGSPRWILGLMVMANVLHPQIFDFDVMAEAGEFYQRFYDTDFSLSDVNRSFSKPVKEWEWQSV